MGRLFFLASTAVLFATATPRDVVAQTQPAPNVRLEATIPLGPVSGRIDHMAIDAAGHRLFVAELGNGSVGVVDLDRRDAALIIRGLKEPQGVAYIASSGTLLVASGGDGTLRAFRAEGEDRSYKEIGRIDLGDDADNIRLDRAGNRAFVGYGKGALAVIDTVAMKQLGTIALGAHPESFQVSRADGRLYVNLPNAREIVVVDPAAAKVVANWPAANRNNYPMALDETGRRVLTVFRDPPALIAFAMRDGAVAAYIPTCGDADDVSVDEKRRRVYVSCGAGALDIFEMRENAFHRVAQIPTPPGARTSLFNAELDRLFVAAPARGDRPAAILVFTLG